MKEFDHDIGLKYLRGMHLNDSKATLNSRKDRHENIGMYVHTLLHCSATDDCELFLEDIFRCQHLPIYCPTLVQGIFPSSWKLLHSMVQVPN